MLSSTGTEDLLIFTLRNTFETPRHQWQGSLGTIQGSPLFHKTPTLTDGAVNALTAP